MTYAIFTAIFLVVFVSGILIGIGLQKNHTARIWHKQRRIHTAQLVKARIRAKMDGAETQLRALLARNLIPTFGARHDQR